MAGKKRGAKPDEQPLLIEPTGTMSVAADLGAFAQRPGAPLTLPAGPPVAVEWGSLDATQIERIAALTRARDEGDREATIRTFCECAAMVMLYESPKDPRAPEVPTESERILAELRRRFGANDPRVLHHLQARGLS